MIIHPPEGVVDGPAATQHHEKSALYIAGPGNNPNSKFQIQFSMDARFHGIMKPKNPKSNHRKLGTIYI